MSESVHGAGETGPSQRSVEIGVALAAALLGVTVIVGSLRVGIGWGAEGPRAGFFPFYVSVAILIASAINLASAVTGVLRGKLFSEWGQLRQVITVVIPTAIYVGVIPVLGIYLSSGLLIAAFMKVLGRYRWPFVVLIAVSVPVVTFLMFEKWFLVPLPKGPVEAFLGY